jgi:hypothetical protein
MTRETDFHRSRTHPGREGVEKNSSHKEACPMLETEVWEEERPTVWVHSLPQALPQPGVQSGV